MGKVILSGVSREITVPVKSFNDTSWEDIKRISDAGLAENYWSVGDRKSVFLNGTVGNLTLNGTYYAYIIGFNHNASKEGKNTIHLQFGFDALSNGANIAFVDGAYNSSRTSGTWFNMNNASDNSGGWQNSQMRTNIIPAFKACMPSELQSILKPVTKYSDNTGGGSNSESNVTSTTDEIFLLSEFEVFGVRSYANSTEQNYQEQYEYYSTGNSKNKYRHTAKTLDANWYLRSVDVNTSTSFCGVGISGDATVNTAYSARGFAPAFCV